MAFLKRAKTRLGYYDARRRLLRGPFRRSLRPTDVFLVGHPKSGNTWLAYMLALLLAKDRDRVNLRNVAEYVPFVHGRDDRIRRYARLPDPRVFRNENPQYADLYPRTIYLVRDPRAALVSFWHMHQVMFGSPDFPLGKFLDDYMAMGGIFDTWNSKLERWDRQVAAWLDRAQADPGVHIVRYEEMVADRRRSIEGLVAFLGIPAAPDLLDLAVERGDFGRMRRLEDRFGAEAYEGKARGQGRFVRQGRPEGWRNELSADLASRIETEFEPVMQRAGYL